MTVFLLEGSACIKITPSSVMMRSYASGLGLVGIKLLVSMWRGKWNALAGEGGNGV